MTATPSPRRRRVRMVVITLLLIAAAGAAGTWYVTNAQWREVTDNAYVQGNLVRIAPKVPGQVVQMLREEGEWVDAGTILAVLAPGDAERALEEAKHMLGFAVREVLTRRAAVATAEANLKLRRTTHALAVQEFRRRSALLKNKTVSQEEVDAAETRELETQAELTIAERQLAAAQVQAGMGELTEHPMVQVAQARLREAVRTLNKHRIISPVSGVIAQRYTQMGQVIDAGTPIYSVLEQGNQWVEANFKENQLRFLRPGQPVKASSDLYGNTHTFTGTVTAIGVGTGSEFALLPPQNATGNWIKIVQRVPVRIDVPAEQLADYPLPVGASLEVTVDTHNRTAVNGAPSVGPVSRQAVFEDLDAGADALVESVIARYTGRTTG